MFSLFLMTACAVLGVAAAQSGSCVDADPMPGYNPDLFDGVWYDVAKIQTPLGSVSVARCVCNYINTSLVNETNGDTDVLLSCHIDSPDGPESILYGELREMREPGKWDYYTIPGVSTFPVSWTNVLLTEDYGITYDCGRGSTTVQYCVHFISRQRTIEPAVLQELVAYAESLGLNPRGMDMEYIDQDGCAPVY